MNDLDRTRLQHMLDSARVVAQLTQEHDQADLDHDSLLVGGIAWYIGVIGEAASKVSKELQDATPQIPWPQIIGMRNRLVHGYFDIKLDRLWLTAVESIPVLINELELLLAVDQHGSPDV